MAGLRLGGVRGWAAAGMLAATATLAACGSSSPAAASHEATSSSSTSATTATSSTSGGGSSSGTGSSSGAAGVASCDLLTLADAQGTLGPAATLSSGTGPSCTYATDGGIGALTVTVAGGETLQDFTATYSEGSYRSLSGVGQHAAYQIVTGGGGSVAFLNGTRLVTVSVRQANSSKSGTVPVTEQLLSQLASKADSRLG